MRRRRSSSLAPCRPDKKAQPDVGDIRQHNMRRSRSSSVASSRQDQTIKNQRSDVENAKQQEVWRVVKQRSMMGIRSNNAAAGKKQKA